MPYNARSFAVARRATIRQSAKRDVRSAATSFFIRGVLTIPASLAGPVATLAMGGAALAAAYNAFSAAARGATAGRTAERSAAGIARMDAARAIMSRSQVAMRRGQVRVAAGRLALARAAAVRAAVEMRSTSVLRARAAAAARGKASDGMVDSYTRVQNGRAVRVQGYSRR